MNSARQDLYMSPLSARYASKEISYLFSPRYKILLFRRLWIALAKAQKKLGLPITAEQIAQMEEHLETIDFKTIALYEHRFRHDVFAHIHAFGDLCPKAKPIIHLGATSCYVTDNADLIQCKEALSLLTQKLTHLLSLLSAFAEKEATTPCLGYTHYQSAQPTTFGKRACLWLQDFLLDASDWERLLTTLPFLGAKGAVGTQSALLALFDGNTARIDALEEILREDFGFSKTLPISGQTYTRKLDLSLLNAFASFAASAHKMGTDIRLLSHDGIMVESFGETQVGSSAMPYKRNPILSERVCGIARFVMALSQNPAYTTATQWLERSLDDSSNRRLAIPEAFLGIDAILGLLAHLISHLQTFPKKALEHLQKEMPALVMENILMKAVLQGGDRQALHEKLRKFSHEGDIESLFKYIQDDPAFHVKEAELGSLRNMRSLIGRAPEQVHHFLDNEVQPFLKGRKALPPPPIVL
ncbi:MAG: adenylosuccinate lyase [Chlamydiia bacterium]|nr:adenylosuccinate lyase [Chlamydiia bacterium]